MVPALHGAFTGHRFLGAGRRAGALSLGDLAGTPEWGSGRHCRGHQLLRLLPMATRATGLWEPIPERPAPPPPQSLETVTGACRRRSPGEQTPRSGHRQGTTCFIFVVVLFVLWFQELEPGPHTSKATGWTPESTRSPVTVPSTSRVRHLGALPYPHASKLGLGL